MPPRRSAKSSAPAAPSPPPEVESSATDPVASTSQDAASSDERASSGENPSEQSTSGAGTLEDRMTKMKQLRQRMTESARLNRQDVISEMAVQRASAKALAKLERKKLQVEAMGEKQRAQEEGEDLERKKNWEYTIEDSEKWEKKVARKERRSGFEFSNYDDVARIKYKKDLDDFKPDLAAYNAQKAAASGSSESSSQALQVLATSGDAASSGTVGEHLAGQGLYRDANSFVYADHKPTEDQIDRVIGKLNSDLDKRQKRSRKRENEDQGDITWINEKNRMFNKKLARYYDDVTKETRDNFERGTAL